MVRNVCKIFLKVYDYIEDVWFPLQFVPSTATLDVSSEYDESGRSETFTLNAVVPHRFPILEEELSVKVFYDSGCCREFGSRDFPVRFTIEESDVISISTEYRSPVL